MGAHPVQLQLKVKVRGSPNYQSAGGGVGEWYQWVAIHPACLYPGPHWPPVFGVRSAQP